MPRTMQVAAAVPPEKTSSTARRSNPAAYAGQNDARPKYPRRPGSNILKAAESALTQKAVAMALAGDSAMMRYCLDQLSAQRMKAAEFTLPEITELDDIPKATLAILQAVAAGTITFQEGNELASLIGIHAKAMRDGELARRVECLEEQQGAAADPNAGRHTLEHRVQRLEHATPSQGRWFTIHCRDGEENSERMNELCAKIEREHGPIIPGKDQIIIIRVFDENRVVSDDIKIQVISHK